MKRSSLALVVAGLLVAASAQLTGVAQAAVTHPANLAGVVINPVNPPSPKKAVVTWDAPGGGYTLSGAFDAYLITMDDDDTQSPAPLGADRSRFVDAGDPLSVTFDDLSSATTYYVYVYAIDYTNSGIEVVEPTADTTPDTAVGFNSGLGATLTLNGPSSSVLNGSPVNLSGTLTAVGGGPIVGANTVRVERNPYPTNDNLWVATTVNTTTGGAWAYSDVPSLNTVYRAFYAPAGTVTQGQVGAWTRNLSVDVRKKMTVKITPGTHINAGTALTFKGKLPAVAGSPSYYTDNNVQAEVQRLVAGTWELVDSKRSDADGSYSISITPAANADGRYRVASGLGPAYGDSFTKAHKIVVN